MLVKRILEPDKGSRFYLQFNVDRLVNKVVTRCTRINNPVLKRDEETL